MRQFALIGYPLGHSFSKRYFTEKFEREGITDAVYELMPIADLITFPEIWQKYPDLVGMNVTIPYKQAVMPLLDALDESAREVGAVNCIHRKNGALVGYNTDAAGFAAGLDAVHCPFPLKKALILGSGGAAKAVSYILRQRGIDYKYVSTSQTGADFLSYSDATLLLETVQLIVQTTPLGMAPKLDEHPPISLEKLGNQHFVYDLIYNPLETLFLSKAREQGCLTQNGLIMLHTQAEKAWEIWNT
jgi:shikimate dehydrogenase